MRKKRDEISFQYGGWCSVQEIKFYLTILEECCPQNSVPDKPLGANTHDDKTQILRISSFVTKFFIKTAYQSIFTVEWMSHTNSPAWKSGGLFAIT